MPIASSRHSDSIRNSVSARSKISTCGTAKPEHGFKWAAQTSTSKLVAGTEFKDAETGRLKSPLRRLDTCRGQNLRNERLEIPAENAQLASSWKRAVCSHRTSLRHPSQERNFSMQRRRVEIRLFCLQRLTRRRGRTRKARYSRDRCTDHRRSSIPEDCLVADAVERNRSPSQEQGIF